MEKIKISVQELVNAQSKEAKRALREKLCITRKQLKMIMKDLEQGKCNVNNGFIYVQTEVNTEDKQTDLIRKQIQNKAKEQQIQYVQTKKNNNQAQTPPKGKGGWSYKTTIEGVLAHEICGQEEKTPKSITCYACTINIDSAIFLLIGACYLWRNNMK